MNFNDVTALVKDEEDNLICFLWKVSTPEMKFALRVSLAPFPFAVLCSCEMGEFIFKAEHVIHCFLPFLFNEEGGLAGAKKIEGEKWHICFL